MNLYKYILLLLILYSLFQISSSKKKKKRRRKTCHVEFPCNTCNQHNNCVDCVGGKGRKTSPPCLCMTGYFQQPNKVVDCGQCNYKCYTCENNSNNCKTCKPNRINPPHCPCKQGTFEKDQICLNCSPICKSCVNNETNCQICAEGTGRNQNIPCNCLDGFYEFETIQKNCGQCQYQCSKCAGEPNNCLECRDQDTRTEPPFCHCKPAYFLAPDKSCQHCSYNCETCENENNQCKTCKIGEYRTMIHPDCGCEDGYFAKDGEIDCFKCSPLCKTCSDYNTCIICKGYPLNRNIEPQCNCNSGFYEKNLKCPKCHTRCETCEQQSENCLTCKQGFKRVGNNPSCDCSIGYFEIDGDVNCSQCYYKCISCSEQNTNCQTCKDKRVNPPTCDCMKGLYEYNKECLDCNFRCSECKTLEYNCTKCKEGVGRNYQPPTCLCEDGYYDNGSVIDCVQCQYPCATCIDSPTYCLECGYGLNREDPPSCSCKPGYDQILESCTKECHHKCQQCNPLKKSECTICHEEFPFYIYINRETETKKCYSYCPENYEATVEPGIISYECVCAKVSGCQTIIQQIDDVTVHTGLGYTNNTSNGSIQRCEQDGCQNCWGLPPSMCEECKTGYYLNKQKVCLQCHPQCQTCKGPGIQNCQFCDQRQINSISNINANECFQIKAINPWDNNQDLDEDPENFYDVRRVLSEYSDDQAEEIEIFHRYVKEKISLKDQAYSYISMKVKDKYICKLVTCNITQENPQYFPIQEKGHQLIILQIILSMANIVNKDTNSLYTVSSLNNYFYKNDHYIQVAQEPRSKFLQDFFQQWEWGPTPKKQWYYYNIAGTFKIGQEVYVQQGDFIGLNENTQDSISFGSECFAVNSEKLNNAETDIVNIDLDTFYVVNVCDVLKGQVIQGVYLGKSDTIENTQLHEMYDIENGIDKYVTIDNLINYDKNPAAKNLRIKQGKIFNGCSTGEILGLDTQILDIYDKLYDSQYVDVKDKIKSISRQLNVLSPLPYLRKDFADELIPALTELCKQFPRLNTININSLKRTVTSQFLVYHHGIRRGKECNIGSAAKPGRFRSNHMSGYAIDIGSKKNYTKQYGKYFKNVLSQYNMYWFGEDDAVHYTYKYDQHNTTDKDRDAHYEINDLIVAREINILQQLWNCHNPLDQIETDGKWGPTTRQKVLHSPIDGYPVNNHCNFKDLKDYQKQRVSNTITDMVLATIPQGKEAYKVRKALQRAFKKPEKATGIPQAKNFGKWLKNYLGYKPSNKTYQQAEKGDVAVLQNCGTDLDGHMAVKCSDGKWRSDFIQDSFFIFEDGCQPDYIIYEL